MVRRKDKTICSKYICERFWRKLAGDNSKCQQGFMQRTLNKIIQTLCEWGTWNKMGKIYFPSFQNSDWPTGEFREVTSDVWTSSEQDVIKRSFSILMWEVISQEKVLNRIREKLIRILEYEAAGRYWKSKLMHYFVPRDELWKSPPMPMWEHIRGILFLRQIRKSSQISAECQFANSNFNLKND